MKVLLPLCYGSKIAFVNIYYLKMKELLPLCHGSKIAFVNIYYLKLKSCFPCVMVLKLHL